MDLKILLLEKRSKLVFYYFFRGMLPIIIDNSMRTTDGSCSNSLIWKFSAISYQQGWTDIKTGAPCHALSFASATLVSEAKIETGARALKLVRAQPMR